MWAILYRKRYTGEIGVGVLYSKICCALGCFSASDFPFITSTGGTSLVYRFMAFIEFGGLVWTFHPKVQTQRVKTAADIKIPIEDLPGRD